MAVAKHQLVLQDRSLSSFVRLRFSNKLASTHPQLRVRRAKQEGREREASNLAAPKEIVGAGLGVVKGVLGTAVGIVGTVVEGGARLGNNGREVSGDNTLFLPPMSLRGGPMRNILRNGLTENIKIHFQRLGIKSPFAEEEKASASGVRQKVSANLWAPKTLTQLSDSIFVTLAVRAPEGRRHRLSFGQGSLA